MLVTALLPRFFSFFWFLTRLYFGEKRFRKAFRIEGVGCSKESRVRPSNSPGLVEFAIRLVNRTVLNLPDKQVKFFGEL